MKFSIFALKIKVLSVVLFFAFCPIFAQGYALISMASPTSNTLKDIWGIDNSHLFAVGKSGTFLKFGGSAWQQIAAPITNDLSSLWGSSSTDVWMVGGGGAVLHYDGSSVSQITIGTSNNLSKIFGFSANDIYLCGVNGTLYHYDGISWSSISSGYGNVAFRGMFGVASHDIYIVGEDDFSPYTYRILHYDGSSFTDVKDGSSSTSFHGGIWSADNNTFYLNGDNLYSFNKANNSLTTVYSAYTQGLYCFSATDIFSGDYLNGAIIHFDGISGTSISGASSIEAIFAPNNDRSNIYMVGDGGGIYHLDMTVGIEENNIASDFSVYPNPTAGEAIINLQFASETGATVELYDFLGQRVSELFSGTAGNGRKIEFDGSALKPGVYFIKVTAGNRSFSQKLILTN